MRLILQLTAITATIQDPHLRQLLAFGIGMHHAGLNQVRVCTLGVRIPLCSWCSARSRDGRAPLRQRQHPGAHRDGHARLGCVAVELGARRKLPQNNPTSPPGVNFPAHLVIVKGTEFFDKKTNRYVDMPVTGERGFGGNSKFMIPRRAANDWTRRPTAVRRLGRRVRLRARHQEAILQGPRHNQSNV